MAQRQEGLSPQLATLSIGAETSGSLISINGRDAVGRSGLGQAVVLCAVEQTSSRFNRCRGMPIE